jgi:predicted aspartyl protease
MKNARWAGFAIRVALLYFTLAGVCQSMEAQSEIRFRLVHDAIIVVSLTADEQGPFDFVLDTGADTTIVDPALAHKLSLVSLAPVQETTLAGVQTLTSGSVRTLAAGRARVDNLVVLIQDLAELRRMDSHVEGIAGQDFLSHFNYLLDYRRHLLRVELADEIRDNIQGDRVPVEVRENRMIVASQAQSRRHAKLRLLVDSGANSVVLIPTASQALNLPTEERGIELTSSGQVEMQVGRVDRLTVGSEQLHDLAVALPAAEPRERIGDGLLPTALFQAVYVNNREGFIVFNPRVKKI